MADIAGATILSADRVKGSWIEIWYSAGASGYDRVYVWIRTLTGPWKQATTDTLLGGHITVTSIAGVALDAKKSYQVKLLARHTSGNPVAESGVSTVPAWSVATPTLLGAARTGPTFVRLSYSGATVPDGAKIYVDYRATPTGTWKQNTAFNPSSHSGTYSINVPSANSSYEVRIYAGQWGVASGYSSSRSVAVWETPTPAVASVTRTSAGGASVSYTGAVPGATLYVQRRVPPLGAWSTKAVSPSSASGTTTLTGLAGPSKYDVRAYTVQSGVRSSYSGEKSLEAWYSLPAGVSDLAAARRPDGTVDLAWTGSPTSRAPYGTQQVYRAEGDIGQLAPLSGGLISGSRRTYYDGTAKPEREYRYTVVPINTAGEATSRPVRKTGASTLAPNAPNSTTAVYVSDSSADVSWPDSSTTEKPVTSWRVRRWLLGNWSLVKDGIPGSVLSWRDPGLSKNSVYKYQIQAVNAAGGSVAYSPESDEVITTPAGAVLVAAGRVGADVRVQWAPRSGLTSIAGSWDVDHTSSSTPATAPENEWFPVSSGTLAGSARQFVHESVAGDSPHTYRVRPTLTGAPVAPWVMSSTVSAYSKPNPPTVSQPVSVDATGVIRLPWVHNPVDGTPQESATVRYRESQSGTGGWTSFFTVTGSQGFYDIPAGTFSNGDVVQWQVATKGTSSDQSNYSITAFTTGIRPTVYTFAPEPGVPHKSSMVTVRWSTGSQSRWTVRLLDGNGTVVDVLSGTGAATREATFTNLKDRGSYTVEVVVNDGVQDSLPATVTFTVELDRPAPPVLTATPNPDDGTVLLTALPVQGMKLLRVNHFNGRLDGWGLEVSDVLLSDGSKMWQATTALLGYTETVVARHLSMDVSRDSTGGAAIVDRRNINQSLNPTPLIPSVARLEATGTTVAGVQWEFSAAGRGGGYFGRVLDMRWPTAAPAPTDLTYFDGDTRRDGYIYGWNPDGTAYEAVPTTNPAEADMPVALTTRIQVIRINADGTEKDVGDTGPGGRLTDQRPPLGVDYHYIARAWTDANAYADSDWVAVRVDSRDVHVNFGTGWTGHVRGGSRGFGGTGGGRESAPMVYAGHRFATNHQAELLGPRTGSVTVQLLPATGVSSLAEWIAALGAAGNVTYRESGGLIIEGAAQLVSWDPGTRFSKSIQFSITEVDSGEGNSTGEKVTIPATRPVVPGRDY